MRVILPEGEGNLDENFFSDLLRARMRAMYLKIKEKKKNIKFPPGRFQMSSERVIKAYIREMIEELKTGAEVWLPARFGSFQLILYPSKVFYHPNRDPNAKRINYWVKLHWAHRYRFKFSQYIKISAVRRGLSNKVIQYLSDNPDEKSKIQSL